MTDTQHRRGRPTQGTEAKSIRYGLRLTPARKQQLEELSTLYGCSIAEVIDLAIDLLQEQTNEGN